MKNKLFAFLPVLLMVFAFAPFPLPKIHFENKEIDLGKIEKKELYKETFVFKNIGEEVLVIDKIHSSCGCATASYTKTPISPGAMGEITVTYKPKKTDKGFISKSFIIDFNEGNFRDHVYLKGIIE